MDLICFAEHVYLEEASGLKLEDKLVMHLVGWLVFTESGPFIKQDHHLLPKTWRI